MHSDVVVLAHSLSFYPTVLGGVRHDEARYLLSHALSAKLLDGLLSTGGYLEDGRQYIAESWSPRGVSDDQRAEDHQKQVRHSSEGTTMRILAERSRGFAAILIVLLLTALLALLVQTRKRPAA